LVDKKEKDVADAEARRCRRCRSFVRRGNAGELCAPCARTIRASDEPPSLLADFYERPSVRTALRNYDFGQFFRAARTELGLTQDEFGRLVELAQSRVCKVENGGLRLRDIATVARFASTLGVPVDLLGFPAGLGTWSRATIVRR
jgi:DNA-binding XRE family transcriptional regulator